MPRDPSNDDPGTVDPAEHSDQSKVDRVYHHLRRLIQETTLPPGAHIQKDAIAAELGVSLAPVSQAINRLAEDMLVDIRPRYGSFVAPVRPHDLRECMFMRQALEVEAARLVAETADPALLETLELNLEQQQQALRGDDLFRLYELDAEFHAAMLEATGFRRAAHISITARVSMDRPRQFATVLNQRAESTIGEHRRIIDAIALKDPDFAAAAMRSHLKLAARSLEAALAQIEIGAIGTHAAKRAASDS